MNGFRKSAEIAETRLREGLAGVELRVRLASLGVMFRETGEGMLGFHVLGRDVRIDTENAALSVPVGEGLLSTAERIIVLRYLCHTLTVKPAGELISFRDLPGGLFYYGPFYARAVDPLVRTVGNDLESLRAGLSRFRWEPYEAADFGAAITVIGPVALYLLYWKGDGEFEARAEYLFDRSVRRIFSADEIAALASHVTGEIRRAVNS